MKHCVFCAANNKENYEAIGIARWALSTIEHQWLLNADATGVYEGSTFTFSDEGNNISIWAEDDDIHRLIYSCMSFAFDRARLIYSNKTNKTI